MPARGSNGLPPVPAPLVDALVQLSFAVQKQIAGVAAEHDQSMIGMRLLGVLRDREPTILELAGLLGLGKSSMSGLVSRAEGRGLVERTTGHADGRSQPLDPTDGLGDGRAPGRARGEGPPQPPLSGERRGPQAAGPELRRPGRGPGRLSGTRRA